MLDQEKIKSFLSKRQCPYLEEYESISHAIYVDKMTPAAYENIIDKGFRRNGFYFYQNICPDCSACIPIRVDVEKFKLSKSQRRCIKKNQNVKITLNKTSFEEEDFLLYKKYCSTRHDTLEDEENYVRFLIESPVLTSMMKYYEEDSLIGIGWIDVMPSSLSSVYFIFDPFYSHKSLGVFSLIKEIELCKKLGKKWLHIGFWIEKCRKMSYKNQYKPYQILNNGIWQEKIN